MRVESSFARLIGTCLGVLLSLSVFVGPTLRNAAAAPLMAIDEQVRPTLVVSSEGEGEVEIVPDQTSFDPGSDVTLTAVPSTSWRFVGWEGRSAALKQWWDTQWDYRVSFTVSAGGFARTDQPVEVVLNFTQLLQTLGVSGVFDPDSLRVVEVDNGGAVIDDSVPFQFDRASNYNAATRARGTLVLIMPGATAASATRRFQTYFDVTGKGFAPPAVPEQVDVIENVSDEGQSAFEVRTADATYFYQKEAAGFSSLLDVNDNDWLSFKPTPNSGAGGLFRGVPNMIYPEGRFHPGDTGSASTLRHAGPIKASIESNTVDDAWKALWEFYPNYATMTLLEKGHNYWFLYEGTPGGVLEPASDRVVRSDGIDAPASQSWTGDLSGDEWVYFLDPNVAANGRALFVVQHNGDDIVDSYRTQAPPNAADGPMTVLGFGRSGTNPLLSATPAKFSIGLVDNPNHSSVKRLIEAIMKPLSVSVAAAETQIGPFTPEMLPSDNPLTLEMDRHRRITAKFEQTAAYSVTASVAQPDAGSVTVEPAGPYVAGQTVTLTAVPAPGWTFSGWSGSLSGAANPASLVVDEDEVVVAHFVPTAYTLTLAAEGAGLVTAAPNGPYGFGQVVTLTAQPEAGWRFDRWSGSLNSDDNPAALQFDENEAVTAHFVQEQYSLTMKTAGLGQISASQPMPYTYGQELLLTAIPDEGYFFDGWSGAIVGSQNPTVWTVEGSAVVTATFRSVVQLAVNAVGGGVVSASPDRSRPSLQAGQYLAGDSVTLTALSGAGWVFAQWSGDLSGSPNPITLMMDGDKTVTAIFKEVVELTVRSVGEGTVTRTPDKSPLTEEPGQYASGDQVVLSASPTAGWRFVGWTGDVESPDATIAVTMETDIEVLASFALLEAEHRMLLPIVVAPIGSE